MIGISANFTLSPFHLPHPHPNPPLEGEWILGKWSFFNSSLFKGEVGRGMGLQLQDYQPNLLPYRFYLRKNLVVSESENAKPSRLQFLCAILVISCLLSMLSPIHLNYQFVLQADKIENVITKWMLATKFQTGNLSTSQEMPQRLFRIGHVIA